jgi:DNA-binding HxlR family transcriptional regulator
MRAGSGCFKNAPFGNREKALRTVDLTGCVYVDAVRALKRIKGRWKTPILAALAEGPLRYSELRRTFPTLTPKMLAQQLDALEQDGVVTRTELVAEPPKVVLYSLSPLGEEARPLLAALADWGVAVARRQAPGALAAQP